jgi:hypothetical protein
MTSLLIRLSFMNKSAFAAGLFFLAHGDNGMLKGSAKVDNSSSGYWCFVFILVYGSDDETVGDYFFSTCSR